jgi:hypothetical protein
MAFQNISIHYQKHNKLPIGGGTHGADAHFVEVADFEDGLVSRVELHHLLGRRQDVLTRYGHLAQQQQQQQDIGSVPCDCAKRGEERVPCCGGVGALGGAGRGW